NCSLYFVMKNTPKVGRVSNFWGAVQLLGPFCFRDAGCDRLSQAGTGSVARAALRYGQPARFLNG
ncbi:hypothetical protein ACGTRS_25085, partial [Burkholderia semiarida]